MAEYENLSDNELLVKWESASSALEKIKHDEMELRKLIFKRLFPNAIEGTNTLPLGNGYELKGVKKFNYKLANDNDKVNAALDKISNIGEQGKFLAERLVGWKPELTLKEYRLLVDNASDAETAMILKSINEILTITEGSPTLEIKAPKK